MGTNSATVLKLAEEEKTVTAGRMRDLAVRQCEHALKELHTLEEQLATLREGLRTAKYRLTIGHPAGSIGCTGGADTDMQASRLARGLDRLMVLLDVAYSAEEGVQF